MRIVKDIKSICAVTAAAAGAAFMSGREAATFFAVTGRASWFGIAAAAAVFGLTMGILARFGQDTGADTFPGIYTAKMNQNCGDAIGVVYALLMLMMGAVALSTSGELGMLSLSVKYPSAAAYVITLAPALMLTLRRTGCPGAPAVPACILFCIALGADKRPPQAGMLIQNSTGEFGGNVSAAIFMGAMFAFLKSAAAGGVALKYCGSMPPRRFGIISGCIMALLAGCANYALQSAGRTVWPLNLPFVVLAARWGVFGYYLSVYIIWLGCLASLTCALSSLVSLFPKSFPGTSAALISAAGVAMLSAAGLRPLVGAGYPVLGWVFCLCLCALFVFYERPKTV